MKSQNTLKLRFQIRLYKLKVNQCLKITLKYSYFSNWGGNENESAILFV